ncbi:Uncharacterized protein Adt_35303 [Abeliophyllum distichum]|uniref:Transposase n=1 Tax=Abeliophyllum distichum TaxID=126358 RepID=A0ABD1QEB9_9LAMI
MTIHDLNVVKHQLWAHGFDVTYTVWVFHGESFRPKQVVTKETDEVERITSESDDDEVIDMLHDLGGMTNRVGTPSSVGEQGVENRSNNTSNVESQPCFNNMFNEAFSELHPNCRKFTSLNFIIKLMQIKSVKWME